jgi:hypothetical protein
MGHTNIVLPRLFSCIPIFNIILKPLVATQPCSLFFKVTQSAHYKHLENTASAKENKTICNPTSREHSKERFF